MRGRDDDRVDLDRKETLTCLLIGIDVGMAMMLVTRNVLLIGATVFLAELGICVTWVLLKEALGKTDGR